MSESQPGRKTKSSGSGGEVDGKGQGKDERESPGADRVQDSGSMRDLVPKCDRCGKIHDQV